MAKLSGVYAIFGPDGRVYVGEAENIARRATVRLARALGVDWTIVCYLPGSSGPQRNQAERAVMAKYRASGCRVVSQPKGSGSGIPKGTPGYVARWSPERRAEHSARMRVLMGAPAWRALQSARMKAFNADRTPEQRRVYGFKSWETRRARALGKVG